MPPACAQPSWSPAPPSLAQLPSLGLAALTDLPTLAALRPPGYHVGQVSSHDHSDGNSDLGIGLDTLDLFKILARRRALAVPPGSCLSEGVLR